MVAAISTEISKNMSFICIIVVHCAAKEINTYSFKLSTQLLTQAKLSNL